MINAKLLIEVFNRTVKGLRAKTEVWAHSCWGNPSQQRMFAAGAELQERARSLQPGRRRRRHLRNVELRRHRSRSHRARSSQDKKISIGVIDHHTLQVETPEEVAAQIRRALKHIPADRLMISTDCGMGREGMSRRHAFYKMRVAGARHQHRAQGARRAGGRVLAADERYLAGGAAAVACSRVPDAVQRDANACTADPGPFQTPPSLWSRVCSTPLRAALRPGHVQYLLYDPMNLALSPARTRSRRQARHRRPDRRRQVRHHVPVAGAADARPACGRGRRPQRRARRKPACNRRLASRSRFAASSLGDALKMRTTHVTADAQALIAHPGIEVIVEATGIPEAGIVHALKAIEHGKHIVMVNVEADALAGSAARAQGEGGGRGLQPRLGRPAGADLRARRLGARLRLQGGRGGQGHALRAALSPVQSRQRLGHSRQVPEHHRSQVDQSEDVQLVRRRHQVGHRDDGGVQRHRARAAERWPELSAGDALRAGRGVQAEERRRHAGEAKASPRSRRRSIATAATCRIISRSAPTW